MRTLIHKEAYRAARPALGLVVLASVVLALSVASGGNGAMPGHPTDQLGAMALVTQIFALTLGWLAFRDDADANAQLMTATRPFSRHVVWSVKVGTWAAVALLSSACILAPTTLLPGIFRSIAGRGAAGETPVVDTYLVIALALSWCGLLLLGAWIGQFRTRATGASGRGLPFLTKFAALLGPCSQASAIALWLFAIVPAVAALAGEHGVPAGETDTQLAVYVVTATGGLAVASALAAYAAYVSCPVFEINARMGYAAGVFWAIVAPLVVAVVVILRLHS